ncbi:hypothetical protein BST86_01770 [Nonlabens agnitus]|uniref:Uncharacterized protein n=1 Tax=Nonlabens agnitus TaxID=870484 RepID=A0A2S9WR03_9FLAO|nr:hypothetical protein BST86_01770 [Nonlabens agnitus]
MNYEKEVGSSGSAVLSFSKCRERTIGNDELHNKNHISTLVYIELAEMLDTGSKALLQFIGKPVRATVENERFGQLKRSCSNHISTVVYIELAEMLDIGLKRL